MNLKIVFKTIGKLFFLEATLLIIPLIISLFNHEAIYLAYIIPMGILYILAFALNTIKEANMNYHAREGFATVGLAWLLLSLFGSLPLIISGVLPNFFDAFFEIASGFTTTGSSVISNVEAVEKSILFWRALTIWVGGMGILVFIIAIIPQSKSRSIYLLKAESTGIKVGKLTSKITFSARILYLIYFSLTLILIILLLFKIPLFDSITYALSAAGTGGFAIHNNSVAFYNSVYVEVVLTVFVILFGINFNIFYLILIGKVKQALKSEELRVYLSIIITSIIIITINTLSIYNNLATSLRHSSFQVASIMTTTGFSSTDFNLWPSLSKWVLIILMFIGASAGSTAGGLKVSRVIIYFKTVVNESRYSLNPNRISLITFDKKPLDDKVTKGVYSFLSAYFIVLIVGVLLISIDGFDITTNFTAALTAISNVGPGFNLIGPAGNFSIFSNFSKFVLALIMIIGRLEIYPILILFNPKLYKKK